MFTDHKIQPQIGQQVKTEQSSTRKISSKSVGFSNFSLQLYLVELIGQATLKSSSSY